MPFKEVTFAENQRVAEELLDYYGIKRIVPIDPEILLRKMRIRVIPHPGLYKRYGIRGFVAKLGSRMQVYVDEYHYMHQEQSSRFTLGEEIGHIVLHLDQVDQIESIDDWYRILLETDEYRRYLESQARVFASNVLLPAAAFRDYVLNWVSDNTGTLSRFQNVSDQDLPFNIAMWMQEDIEVSAYILEIALLRWPDRVIDAVIDEYPGLTKGGRMDNDRE